MEQDEHDRYALNVDHSDDTKVEKARPLQRVEVITGVERRRNWSEHEKLSIVAESMADGVVISDVARRHGLSPQQLFGWRSQFKARAAEFMEQRAPAFAPAIVDQREPLAHTPAQPFEPLSEPSSSIEVTVGRARIVIRGTVDQRTIATVLKALKGLA